MTKQEQKEFVTGILKSIEDEFDSISDKIPAEWNGTQLGWWIADTVTHRFAYPRRNRRTKKHKDYSNDVVVKNL